MNRVKRNWLFYSLWSLWIRWQFDGLFSYRVSLCFLQIFVTANCCNGSRRDHRESFYGQKRRKQDNIREANGRKTPSVGLRVSCHLCPYKLSWYFHTLSIFPHVTSSFLHGWSEWVQWSCCFYGSYGTVRVVEMTYFSLAMMEEKMDSREEK